MNKNMNPVIHFQLPAEDINRMSEFYSRVFGWNTQKLGEEMGNYVVVQTGDTDDKGELKDNGIINGGLFPKTEANSHPVLVIAVLDIYESMKKVEEAGGKVLGGGGVQPGEPYDIPNVGLYSSFIDSEGNRMAMLQPKNLRNI